MAQSLGPASALAPLVPVRVDGTVIGHHWYPLVWMGNGHRVEFPPSFLAGQAIEQDHHHLRLAGLPMHELDGAAAFNGLCWATTPCDEPPGSQDDNYQDRGPSSRRATLHPFLS